MKVEAIIVDGKKYVPTDYIGCKGCAFEDKVDETDDCFITGPYQDIHYCDLFYGQALKLAEE